MRGRDPDEPDVDSGAGAPERSRRERELDRGVRKLNSRRELMRSIASALSSGPFCDEMTERRRADGVAHKNGRKRNESLEEHQASEGLLPTWAFSSGYYHTDFPD